MPRYAIAPSCMIPLTSPDTVLTTGARHCLGPTMSLTFLARASDGTASPSYGIRYQRTVQLSDSFGCNS